LTARLLRAERHGREFALVFAVRDGNEWREASVLVSLAAGHPLFAFPHILSAAGESLGTDEADAALTNRAQQFIDAREAGRLWDAFVRSARR
jgi:hypothetical protein